jgi:hypothetical protein
LTPESGSYERDRAVIAKRAHSVPCQPRGRIARYRIGDDSDITTFGRRGKKRLAANRLPRFLVALPPVRDLLLCAKHLFVEAMHGFNRAQCLASKSAIDATSGDPIRH